MLLEIFGFLKMTPADIIDILMVALLLFWVFRWIKGSSAMNLFIGVVGLFVVWVVVEALGMKLMSAIMGTFINVGVIALIVIFQPEIRRFLIRVGSGYGLRRKNFISRVLGFKEVKLDSETVKELTEACRNMSETKTGALIVLPGQTSLESIIETGDRIDAVVNRRLIMNLFFKNSPLHDGAMIIDGNRIVAARCTLPITGRSDIPPQFGMRHKAAIGISEETDASVIVVSEETGNVSYVQRGEIRTINNLNELKLLLGDSSEQSDQ